MALILYQLEGVWSLIFIRSFQVTGGMHYSWGVVEHARKDRAELKKLVKDTNGKLEKYSIMPYWSRPAIGIKQGDGKQARHQF